ncbi:hypothetical protein FOL46_003722, partial [Perkinsus olseni]
MLMTGTIPKPPASLDDIAPRDRWSSQGVFGGINLKEASGEDVAAEEAKLVEVLRKRASDIRRRRDDCLRDFNMVWLERREEARNSFDQTLARKQTKESLKVGDRVLLAERSPSKLAPRWSKPQGVVALRGLRCIIKDDNGTLREVHLRYVRSFVVMMRRFHKLRALSVIDVRRLMMRMLIMVTAMAIMMLRLQVLYVLDQS